MLMNKYCNVLIMSILFIQFSCTSNSNKANETQEHQSTTGINFFAGNFTEALSKAKAENKLVFMDAYTSWCGPCKMMKQNTFPDAMVGKVFNEKYVSVAIDMEAGEGIELAQKYQVQGYPTLLFLDAEGNIIKNELGYRDPAGLIALSNDIATK
jgi:thioredoxin 1